MRKLLFFLCVASLVTALPNLFSDNGDDEDDDNRRRGRRERAIRSLESDKEENIRAKVQKGYKERDVEQVRPKLEIEMPRSLPQERIRTRIERRDEQAAPKLEIEMLQSLPRERIRTRVRKRYREKGDEQVFPKIEIETPRSLQQDRSKYRIRVTEPDLDEINEEQSPSIDTSGRQRRIDLDKSQDRQRERTFSKEEFRKKRDRWSERRGQFRNKFSDHRRRHHIFDDLYWSRFRSYYRNWHFDNRYSWFVVTPWTQVTVWLPWRWETSIYYFHDDYGRVYYTTNLESEYLIPVNRSSILYVNAISLANSSRYFSNNQSDWLPLGTFGIFTEENISEMPQEYVSLAISKDGAVTGAYVNVEDNQPIQIEGAIDEDSQRIAWKLVGRNWPVMETGLYNLTKPESTILIHLFGGRKQVGVIVQAEE